MLNPIDFYLRALVWQHALSESGTQRELSELVEFVWSSIQPKHLELIGCTEECAMSRLNEILHLEGLGEELKDRIEAGTLDETVQRYCTFRKPFEGGASYVSFLHVDLPWHTGWLVVREELVFDGPPAASSAPSLASSLQSLTSQAYTPSRPPLPTPSTSLASSTCSHTPGTPGSDDSFTTFRTVDTGDQTSYIVLPYDIQHSILPRVQTLLEHTFFSFLDKHAPHVLVSKGWDTPTAAELTTYTRDLRWILFSDRSLEPLFPPTWGSGDTSNILRQLDEIRHVSVHRRPVTFEKLLCLLDSASSAASLFWDGGAGEDYWEIVHIKESAQYWMDNIDKSRGIAEEDCARERFELERTVAGKISRMEAEKRERIMEAERLGVKCLRMAFWYSGSAKGFEMGSEESG